MTTSYTNAALMSSISGMLKEDWVSNLIHDQYGRDTPLLALVEKGKEEVEGTDAVLTVRLAPNTSTGARAEMGDLPNPGRQTTAKVRVPLSFWYTTCAFSGPAIKASKSNAGSLARIVTDELENAIKDHKKVENYFFYGDGNGSLAQVSAIDTLTVTLDRWPTVLAIGRRLDSYSARSSGTKRLDSATITAISRTNKTITLDAVTSLQVGDFLYLEDTYTVVSQGLMAIADDGTYAPTFQSLLRSSYPSWKGKVFSGSGATAAARARMMSEDLLLDVIARQREDGVKPDLCVGTSFQLRDLCAEAKEQRRFMDPKTKLDLGVSGITIGDGVDFTYDSDCHAGYTFMLRRGGIKLIEADPLGFMDMDGNVLKHVSGKDAYEAILFHYFNLCAFTCFDQSRIEDIIENRVGDS